ncbi:MAG: hypothetical protein MUP73_04500 [Dehalococcoidia bacterium]|nr:hypothetical protein [Dehalococcoidia bacterium]
MDITISGHGYTRIPSTIMNASCMWVDGYAPDGPIGDNGMPAMPMTCRARSVWMTCGGKPEPVMATVCRPRCYCERHKRALTARAAKSNVQRSIARP